MTKRPQKSSDKTTIHRSALSEEYSNIRIIDKDAAVIMSNGKAWTVHDMTTQLPLCIINRDETHHADIEYLKEFYRKIYSNQLRLEHRMEYDINTESLEGKAVAKRRRTWFFDMYPGAKNEEYEVYESLSPERRDKYLAQMYDRDKRFASIGHVISDTNRKFADCESEEDEVEYRGEKLRAELEAKNKEAMPENEEHRAKIREGFKVVPEDFMTVLNHHGASIVCADSMLEIDSTAAGGISFPANGVIKFDVESLGVKHFVIEEVIHYLDHMEGFTADKKWVDAVEEDTKSHVSRMMMDMINEAIGKGSLLDHHAYQESMIPCELLPDLDKAANEFDTIIAHIRKESVESPELNALLRVIDKNTDKNGKVDSEKIMGSFFPNTWPRYRGYDEVVEGETVHVKGFVERIHDHAEAIRAKQNGLPADTWKQEITAQDTSVGVITH